MSLGCPPSSGMSPNHPCVQPRAGGSTGGAEGTLHCCSWAKLGLTALLWLLSGSIPPPRQVPGEENTGLQCCSLAGDSPFPGRTPLRPEQGCPPTLQSRSWVILISSEHCLFCCSRQGRCGGAVGVGVEHLHNNY